MTSALFGLSSLAPEGVGQNFRSTMRRFPATVTVITACASGDQRDHGMTVTAVTSVSMEPPSLLVCLNNRTLLHELLLCRPDFIVNVPCRMPSAARCRRKSVSATVNGSATTMAFSICPRPMPPSPAAGSRPCLTEPIPSSSGRSSRPMSARRHGRCFTKTPNIAPQAPRACPPDHCRPE